MLLDTKTSDGRSRPQYLPSTPMTTRLFDAAKVEGFLRFRNVVVANRAIGDVIVFCGKLTTKEKDFLKRKIKLVMNVVFVVVGGGESFDGVFHQYHSVLFIDGDRKFGVKMRDGERYDVNDDIFGIDEKDFSCNHRRIVWLNRMFNTCDVHDEIYLDYLLLEINRFRDKVMYGDDSFAMGVGSKIVLDENVKFLIPDIVRMLKRSSSTNVDMVTTGQKASKTAVGRVTRQKQPKARKTAVGRVTRQKRPKANRDVGPIPKRKKVQKDKAGVKKVSSSSGAATKTAKEQKRTRKRKGRVKSNLKLNVTISKVRNLFLQEVWGGATFQVVKEGPASRYNRENFRELKFSEPQQIIITWEQMYSGIAKTYYDLDDSVKARMKFRKWFFQNKDNFKRNDKRAYCVILDYFDVASVGVAPSDNSYILDLTLRPR